MWGLRIMCLDSNLKVSSEKQLQEQQLAGHLLGRVSHTRAFARGICLENHAVEVLGFLLQ